MKYLLYEKYEDIKEIRSRKSNGRHYNSQNNNKGTNNDRQTLQSKLEIKVVPYTTGR